MKKLFFTVCLLMAAMFLTAQDVPQAINFQAIARDANSEVMANTQIMIQLTILDGSPEGTQIYREIRSLMTNNYGSFSFQIGRDPYMAVGEFADIDWAGGRKFLKIDYDPTAMLQFNLSLGTVEFVSVPYAFAAGSVSYIDASGANDGDVLAYNATTGRFEPVAMSGAGGGITVETDPTVPDWAKAETKPTYDYSEIENTPDLNGYLTTESQTLADAAALGNSVNAQLKNVTDPTDAQDAVTKSYVDNLIAQLQEAINNIDGGSNPVNTSIVVTGIASDITATSAIISAEITSGGDLSVTSRGFVYGTSESDLSQTVPVDGNLGPYMATLNDLTPNTTYYYKAYATNILGTAYGDVMSFTLIATYPPTVITTVASEITATGATISGNVTSDGGFAVTERGFVYGTSADELTQTATCGSGSGSYTKTLNNLTPNTTYYYKAYATNRLGTAYGDVLSFTLIATYPPTVITTVASEITVTGATISGNVTSDGGFAVTERGFVYGTSADELTQTATCGSGSGSYTKTLNNLTPNTTYYYKTYATNRLGTAYGDVMSFTLIATYPPTVITTVASEITVTGATISGNVTSDGGFSVTERGFVYGTNADELTQTATCGSGSGSYTKTLNNLTPNTTYYYKAYATNRLGTAYGDVMSFTTLAIYPPSVQTNSATNITTTGATLSGDVTFDGNTTVTARGFIYGTDANNLTQSVQSGSGTGSFTKTLTGLSYGTTYYYKAYATNSGGTSYGDVRTFTTIAVYLPTVTTGTASSVTTTGATLSGNVTSDGNATVTARGFVYGTSANNLSQTVQSGSGTGSFTKTLTGLSPSTTYYYKAYATNTAGTAYGDVMTFTTLATTGTLNGHEWVDLGLPSGTRWATCNVGASTPTDYGNYYAWGETTTKSSYTEDTYTYSSNPTTLPSSADAATANWGSGWRMPTKTEMQELVDNCTVTWTTQSGVNGRLFTGPNGNSIFLPAAGDRYDSSLENAGSSGLYWSSSLTTDDPNEAWFLFLYQYDYYMLPLGREVGQSVRAVCQSQN